MITHFKKTSLALALSAMLMPLYCAAGEPAEGVKAGLVTLEQDVSQRNNVPVYFIGSYQDNLVLQNAGVSVLHNALERQDKMAISHFDFKSNALTLDDESASSRLVVVDGNYVANLRQGTWEKVRAYLREAALAGNPVIAFGDTRIGENLLPDHPDPSLPQEVGTEEGKSATAWGMYRSPQGNGRDFFTNETDILSVMKNAKAWAKDVLDEQDQIRFLQSAEKDLKAAPGWSSAPAYQRNTLWDVSPYGKIHVKTFFTKLANETNTSYDWWLVHVQQLNHPSLIAFGNDTWRNADAWTNIQVDRKISSGFLADYGPTTTAGSSTTSVGLNSQIGSSGGSYTVTASWAYTASDMQVNDQTIGNTAKWWHNINEKANVGWNTVNLQPGLIARVPNGTTAIYNQFWELYQGQWAHHRCGLRICGWDSSGYRGLQWNN